MTTHNPAAKALLDLADKYRRRHVELLHRASTDPDETITAEALKADQDARLMERLADMAENGVTEDQAEHWQRARHDILAGFPKYIDERLRAVLKKQEAIRQDVERLRGEIDEMRRMAT